MAQSTSTYRIKDHPALIIVGTASATTSLLEDQLKQLFCSSQSCNLCRSCQRITEKQHPQIEWLLPQKNYTLEHINAVLDKTTFALQDDEHFFFIFQKADCLSTTTGNRLLKLIEEPPKNYFFIFLTPRLESMLPTIRSRSLVITTSRVVEHSLHPLIKVFLNVPCTLSAPDYIALLDQQDLSEHESFELCDYLLAYWQDRYKKYCEENSSQQNNARTIIKIFEEALRNAPAPGGSKFFWKNLYLQLSTLQSMNL